MTCPLSISQPGHTAKIAIVKAFPTRIIVTSFVLVKLYWNLELIDE